MANDQFGEKIILLNKEKVCSSANTKSDEFFRKTVAFNVLSFWSYKEAVLQVTGATSYSNCYSFVAKLLNVFLLVKHMINDSIFKKKLSHIDIPNNIPIFAFLDLFYIGSIYLLNDITLSKYIDSAQGN